MLPDSAPHAASYFTDCFPHPRCGATPDKLMRDVVKRGCGLGSGECRRVRKPLHSRVEHRDLNSNTREEVAQFVRDHSPCIVGIPSPKKTCTGPHCELNGPVNHAVLALFVNESQALIQNSWGHNWGVEGRALIDLEKIEYAAAFICEEGD